MPPRLFERWALWPYTSLAWSGFFNFLVLFWAWQCHSSSFRFSLLTLWASYFLFSTLFSHCYARSFFIVLITTYCFRIPWALLNLFCLSPFFLPNMKTPPVPARELWRSLFVTICFNMMWASSQKLLCFGNEGQTDLVKRGGVLSTHGRRRERGRDYIVLFI